MFPREWPGTSSSTPATFTCPPPQALRETEEQGPPQHQKFLGRASPTCLKYQRRRIHEKLTRKETDYRAPLPISRACPRRKTGESLGLPESQRGP